MGAARAATRARRDHHLPHAEKCPKIHSTQKQHKTQNAWSHPQTTSSLPPGLFMGLRFQTHAGGLGLALEAPRGWDCPLSWTRTWCPEGHRMVSGRARTRPRCLRALVSQDAVGLAVQAGSLTSSDTLNRRSNATTFCLKFCCCKTSRTESGRKGRLPSEGRGRLGGREAQSPRAHGSPTPLQALDATAAAGLGAGPGEEPEGGCALPLPAETAP